MIKGVFQVLFSCIWAFPLYAINTVEINVGQELSAFNDHSIAFYEDINVIEIFHQKTLIQSLLVPAASKETLLFDWDGDGYTDILVLAGSVVYPYLWSPANKKYNPAANINVGPAAFMRKGDLDGDGYDDLVFAYHDALPTQVTEYIYQFLNTEFFIVYANGNTKTINTNGKPLDLVIGDVTGDGKNDLIVPQYELFTEVTYELIYGPWTEFEVIHDIVVWVNHGSFFEGVNSNFLKKSNGKEIPPLSYRGLGLADFTWSGQELPIGSWYAIKWNPYSDLKPLKLVGFMIPESDGSIKQKNQDLFYDAETKVQENTSPRIWEFNGDGFLDVLFWHKKKLSLHRSKLKKDTLYYPISASVVPKDVKSLAQGDVIDFDNDGITQEVLVPYQDKKKKGRIDVYSVNGSGKKFTKVSTMGLQGIPKQVQAIRRGAIVGATIKVGPYTLKSDALGRVQLFGVPPGQYQVSAFHPSIGNLKFPGGDNSILVTAEGAQAYLVSP
ncbi:MAG: VCBS repeat-containing protein [Deltaproteobacteria bacterium]|nr:VCBS repeat-containing protein [Deltaproteobacteria bacterium]